MLAGVRRKGPPAASGIMLILRLTAILAMTIVPVQASDFSTMGAEVNDRTLFQQVAVFSDVPNSIHDPRHPQSQTGPDKMFAPIGLIWTNHRQPDQGTAPRSVLYGNGLPCFAMLHLTAYHVVFGYRLGFLKGKEQPEQYVSATFSVGGQKSRAVPVKWSVLHVSRQGLGAPAEGAGCGHRVLGEEPNIAGFGWLLVRRR